MDRLFETPVVNGTNGLRIDVDTSNERMQKKIRDAQLQKIPYMLVVGEREAAEGTVLVRLGRQGSGRHAPGYSSPYQNGSGIPPGCGRIALFPNGFQAYLVDSARQSGRIAPPRRVIRNPVCVHDRTSFRLAPTDRRDVMARGS